MIVAQTGISYILGRARQVLVYTNSDMSRSCGTRSAMALCITIVGETHHMVNTILRGGLTCRLLGFLVVALFTLCRYCVMVRFVEYHVNNWMLLVGAVVELIFMAFCWGSINRSAEVISVASAGLKATPSVLGVSLLVEAMYVGYTALWIVFLITTFHVKEVVVVISKRLTLLWYQVDGTSCSLDEPSWVAVSRWIYGPMFFIFTYVFLNMKTVVCAVGVGAW